jgi:HK97 family phage prohead protease
MPIPTAEMAHEAQRGLDWRKEYNRGGTEVGVARARDIVNRKNLSEQTIGRMVSYFARHEVDKEGTGFSPGEDGYPSAGRIAWALWGGDPGKVWASKEWSKIQNRKAEIMITRRDISLQDAEIKVSKTGKGSFVGYASVFGGVDSYDDSIMRGAFSAVVDQVNKGTMRMPKMFVNHRSWDIPPGKWTKMVEDERGLYMEGEFTPGNPQADILKASLMHGTIDGLSIGFKVGDYEIIETDEEKLRLIKNVEELPEVSIVTFPADDSARVDLSSVKNSLEQIESLRDLEAFLRDAGGFSRALANATASTAKRLAQRESETKMPDELQRAIMRNLILTNSL